MQAFFSKTCQLQHIFAVTKDTLGFGHFIKISCPCKILSYKIDIGSTSMTT